MREQTSRLTTTLFGVQQFTGSYALSTSVRPVRDLDVAIVMGTGTGKTQSALHLVEILAAKLNRYYDKTTGTRVDGLPDAPQSRPNTLKIAIRALKARRFENSVQSHRSIKVTFPQDFYPLDVLPALAIESLATERVASPALPVWIPVTTVPNHAPQTEPSDPVDVEREQLRQERDLERRARILLRRMLCVPKRRVRSESIVAVDGVDHSTECHRSRAPARKTWSPPGLRALVAA